MTPLLRDVVRVDAAEDALHGVHARQIHRDPWPDFDRFCADDYPAPLRAHASDLWRRRSQMEYASIAQFTRIAAELACHHVPLHWHGVLARIITDEVRHAALCAALARAIDPEGMTNAPYTLPPWPWSKRPPSEDWPSVRGWAAVALLASSCLGEALSVPTYEALVVVATDPVVVATLQQIRKDEPLHAAFGWEAVSALLAEDGGAARPLVQSALGGYLRGFEASMCGEVSLDAIAGRSLDIERGGANLGTITDEQAAFLYYATLEQELLPRLEAIGLDPRAALIASR